MDLNATFRFTPGYLHSRVERRRVKGSEGLTKRGIALRFVFFSRDSAGSRLAAVGRNRVGQSPAIGFGLLDARFGTPCQLVFPVKSRLRAEPGGRRG